VLFKEIIYIYWSSIGDLAHC